MIECILIIHEDAFERLRKHKSRHVLKDRESKEVNTAGIQEQVNQTDQQISRYYSFPCLETVLVGMHPPRPNNV